MPYWGAGPATRIAAALDLIAAAAAAALAGRAPRLDPDASGGRPGRIASALGAGR